MRAERKRDSRLRVKCLQPRRLCFIFAIFFNVFDVGQLPAALAQFNWSVADVLACNKVVFAVICNFFVKALCNTL